MLFPEDRGLRRLPALDLPYDPLSTVPRQTDILVHVHPPSRRIDRERRRGAY
jgi:hypothetical protein